MPAATLSMNADKKSTGTIGQYHAGKIVELREVCRNGGESAVDARSFSMIFSFVTIHRRISLSFLFLIISPFESLPNVID